MARLLFFPLASLSDLLYSTVCTACPCPHGSSCLPACLCPANHFWWLLNCPCPMLAYAQSVFTTCLPAGCLSAPSPSARLPLLHSLSIEQTEVTVWSDRTRILASLGKKAIQQLGFGLLSREENKKNTLESCCWDCLYFSGELEWNEFCEE